MPYLFVAVLLLVLAAVLRGRRQRRRFTLIFKNPQVTPFGVKFACGCCRAWNDPNGMHLCAAHEVLLAEASK